MSYSELVAAIAERSGVTKATVSVVLKTFSAVTTETALAGERVVIPGFGAFTLKEVKPRLVFGKMSEGRRTVKFKAHRGASHGEAGSDDRSGEDEGSPGERRKALP